jgi:aspartyl/asparaginyl beta-hydroxylase (cupin superfamily)
MPNPRGWLLIPRVFRAVEALNRRFSQVPTDPFVATDRFPWVKELESATGDIVRELKAVQRTTEIPTFQTISPEQKEITQDDRWKTFFLYGLGNRNAENCARCPATEAAVRRIPGMKTAMFSILSPGKKIPPHRGPYNGILRYHLGLMVPEPGRCAIRVGHETRTWAVGSSLIFDDTYEHEVTNESVYERVVLFVDIARPLRFPMNLVNESMLEAIRRSPFVTEADQNLLRFNVKQRAAAASPPKQAS